MGSVFLEYLFPINRVTAKNTMYSSVPCLTDRFSYLAGNDQDILIFSLLGENDDCFSGFKIKPFAGASHQAKKTRASDIWYLNVSSCKPVCST